MSDSDRVRPSRRIVLRAGAFSGLALATATAFRGVSAQTPAAPLKIGVIGSGHIGSTLGSLWVQAV